MASEPLCFAWRSHDCTSSGDASGWNWTPQLDPSRKIAFGYFAVRASSTASGGSSVTTSWCDIATVAKPPSTSGPTSGSDAAASVHSRVVGPSSGPLSAPTTTRPPSVSASTWWPRQMPRIGRSMLWASASRSDSGSSHGWWALSCADIRPPSTMIPSPDDASCGTSWSHSDTTENRTRVSASQSSKRSSGQPGSSCRTEMRGCLATRAG